MIFYYFHFVDPSENPYDLEPLVSRAHDTYMESERLLGGHCATGNLGIHGHSLRRQVRTP